MRRTGTSLGAVCVVAGCLSAGAAAGFVCTRADDTGPSVAWHTRSLVLHHQPHDFHEVIVDDINAALTRSAATWTSVSCSDLEVTVGGPLDEHRAGFDWAAGSDSEENVNVVVFRNDDGAADQWLHDRTDALAITTITFVNVSGKLLDADIEVNDRWWRFEICEGGVSCTEADLENMLTHELGHVLGLDHPPDQPEATMFAETGQGETKKRDLDSDDEGGLCFLYPTGSETPGTCYDVAPQAPPNIVVSRGCDAPLAGGLPFLSLCVPLCLARRRRQGPPCRR